MTRRTADDGIAVSPDRRAFKQELVKRMTELNIKPAALSRAAKISKEAMSSYTTMRSLPSKEVLAKLAKALKCKPTDLVNGKPPVDLPVMEMRTAEKPGFSLLVIRVPVPIKVATEILTQLSPYASDKLK